MLRFLGAQPTAMTAEERRSAEAAVALQRIYRGTIVRIRACRLAAALAIQRSWRAWALVRLAGRRAKEADDALLAAGPDGFFALKYRADRLLARGEVATATEIYKQLHVVADIIGTGKADSRPASAATAFSGEEEGEMPCSSLQLPCSPD